jgi:hypothetical protein
LKSAVALAFGAAQTNPKASGGSLGTIEGAMLAGYRVAIGERRTWLHILSFAVITVIIVYVIIDVRYPGACLICLQAFDQLLVDVREGMN